MPGSYYEEDEWHRESRDYHRGPAYGYVQPPPPRRSGELFPPGAEYSGSSMRRSRSIGRSPSPVPNIRIYNRTDVAEGGRDHSPSRGRTDAIVDRLGDIDRDLRQLSRSRGPPEYRGPSPYETQQQALALAEQFRLREADARIAQMEEARRLEHARLAQLEEARRLEHDYRDRDREEDLVRKKIELERLRDRYRDDQESHKWEDREKALKNKLKLKEMEDDLKKQQDEQKKRDDRQRILLERDSEIAKAKAEREKLQAEIKLKEEEEEEERKRLVEIARAKDAEKKKKEEQAEKDAIARWEQKQKAEKDKEEALKAKFRAEEEARKRKEKEEEEAWRMKIKMKEDEEKEKKKRHEKEVEEELHKKMAVFGFQENQIQAVLDPKKAQDLPAGYAPGHPRTSQTQLALAYRPPQPTYIKISREHLDIETLKYYNLPYEIDVDPNYVIIMQEISEHETNILFEHTRKLRRSTSTLLIEDRARGRQGEPQLAFVRRRRPSASPNRMKRDKSPIRVGLNLF